MPCPVGRPECPEVIATGGALRNRLALVDTREVSPEASGGQGGRNQYPPYRWAPGWYRDPWRPDRVRWWDGAAWSGQSAKPVSPWMRWAAAAGSITAVACLVASLTLSAVSQSGAGPDPCRSAIPDPLVGAAFVLGFAAAVTAAPALWFDVRVVRLVRPARGPWPTLPWAAAIVVMILGVPAAAFWWFLAAIAHTCLF